MRPTVDEQLRGMRRILVEVVQPHVVDDYAREQLGHLTAALGPLADGWDAVVPGLLRENARLETLLRTVLPDLEGLAVDPELLARLTKFHVKWEGKGSLSSVSSVGNRLLISYEKMVPTAAS